MVTPKRIQLQRSDWPIWVIPIGIGLAVLGYLPWCQVARGLARLLSLWGLESLHFGPLAMTCYCVNPVIERR